MGLSANLDGYGDDLKGYLDWLETKGISELLWTPDPSGFDGVRKALEGRSFSLTVVLPNMSLYARDAMDAGPTGAVLKRFKALGPLSLAGLGLRLLPRVPSLLEKRFSAGILLLADAEFRRLGGLPVRKVALHNSAVDMALAFGCRELALEFVAWARASGVEAAVLTSNPVLWASRAKDWGVGREAPPTLTWADYRPETPEVRLARWKTRAAA